MSIARRRFGTQGVGEGRIDPACNFFRLTYNLPMKLIELHAHSHFSFLDALASPDELVSRAKELGYSAIALTDHGGMFGIPKFLRAAERAGLQAIVGCEMYVSPTTRTDHSPDLRPVGHHLTVLAETVEGYGHLVKLSTLGYTEGFHHRPRVDRELLSANAGGLIVLTGCIHSALSELLLKPDDAEAERLVGYYEEVFGRDRVFVEVQRHGLDQKEEPLLEKLVALARRRRLGIVATNDVHYLNAADAEAHQQAMDLRSRKLPTDPRRERFLKPAYGLLTESEWKKNFGKDLPEVFDTAVSIAKRCSIRPADIRPGTGAEREDAAERMRLAVFRSVEQRRGNAPAEIQSRIEQELKELEAAGMAEYFMMIHELVSESKRQGIAVGPGRGSSAGSLVARLLDITEIDPMVYGLSFERFLSPSRRTLPDVDLDVDFTRREAVIQILHDLNPSRRVFQAGTIVGIGLKTAVREVSRARGLSYRDVDEKLQSLAAGAARLDPDDKPPWKELAPLINLIAPLPRAPHVHPTALMMVPKSFEAFLPLYASLEGQTWLQYDSEDLDWMGIPKLDILPLKILSVLSETVRWLKIAGIADLELRSIPLDDPQVYASLSRGETAGIFQLESPGMRQMLRDVAPDSIETLAAVLALFRPGPLESDLPRNYVERKHGRMESRPPHPLFESILKETFGLVLYQEQVLACARRAGLTAVEADDFRLAISKKKADLMQSAGRRFEEALRKTGMAESDAASLVHQIAHDGGFSFNKAHAVSYATLCCRAAWLKTRHHAAFLAASANVHLEDRKQLSDIFSEARRLGIRVLPPDIQSCGADCMPDPDGRQIRLGLRTVRHVSGDAAADILRMRPFADIPDLLMKVAGLAQHQTLEMLCKSGALDSLAGSRMDLLGSLPQWMSRFKKSSSPGGFQTELFEAMSPPVEASPAPEGDAGAARRLLFLEHESLGFFATGSPLEEMKDLVSEFCTGALAELTDALQRQSASHPGEPANRAVTVAGLVVSVRPHVDRAGREMGFAKIEDGTGSVDVVFFHDIYVKAKPLLAPGAPLLIQGRLEKKGASVTLLADQVVETDNPERLYESIWLKLDESVGMDTMKKLKEILKDHLGDRPVHVEMSEGGVSYEYRVGWSCRPSGALRRKLELLLGPYSVFFLKSNESALTR